jgi:hypothetical protein
LGGELEGDVRRNTHSVQISHLIIEVNKEKKTQDKGFKVSGG